MLRRFLLALTLVGALVVGGAGSAAAEEERGHDSGLLALGDSVAFGYSPLIVAAGGATNPANFIGYPEIAAKALDLRDTNPSCPGETTGSFFSATAVDNGCRAFRSRFPLHVAYPGTQLAFVLSYLRSHHDVRVVTMDLGANDVFVLQRVCGGNPTCVNQGLPAVLATIQANLEKIFGAIRAQGHFHGRLVTLSYYSLAYDATTAAGTQALNAPIIAATKKFHGVIASGFDAFQPEATEAGGSSCAAGLLIALPTGGCDVHPSPQGRDLLAQAIVRAARSDFD